MVIQPVAPPRRRRTWGRRLALGGLVVIAAGGVLVAAALLAWPRASLEADPRALARVSLPGIAGRVTQVEVRTPAGTVVPVRLAGGRAWPTVRLEPDEALRVTATVRRPRWAGWLVGDVDRQTFTVRTPVALPRGRWLQLATGAPVTVAFDAPVSVVRVTGAGRTRTLRLAEPRTSVPLGIVARGAQRAGAVSISAVARSWERLPAPTRVSWFPPRRHVQLLAEPALGRPLRADRPLTLTFSRPVREVLGDARPTVTPAHTGRWRVIDPYTLELRPTGPGFGLGSRIRVRLPSRVVVVRPQSEVTTRTLAWDVPAGSILRLEQLLAQSGYLPVRWRPARAVAGTDLGRELAAALDPPPGRFSWRYPRTPSELRALWQPGRWNPVVRAAVIRFQSTHHLAVDGFAGPQVWQALLADVVAGRRSTEGYSYVFVHRNVPQSLNLWHNGRILLRSPGNTGVRAAPTPLGTWPVYAHLAVGRMQGTNPDGTHYDDPGVRWISYFNGGDAIHAFPRASYGTPQSLGCVELPSQAAARVWPYTPVGTLVTVES